MVPSSPRSPQPNHQAHLTTHRQAVLETLDTLPDHPDAMEVYLAVRARRPRIAVGTVYAALHHLVACGLIAEVRRPDGLVAYDRDTAPHDHVRCRVCGRFDDVPPAPAHERRAADYATVAGQTGYTIERHRSEFVGLCPTCRPDA